MKASKKLLLKIFDLYILSIVHIGRTWSCRKMVRAVSRGDQRFQRIFLMWVYLDIGISVSSEQPFMYLLFHLFYFHYFIGKEPPLSPPQNFFEKTMYNSGWFWQVFWIFPYEIMKIKWAQILWGFKIWQFKRLLKISAIYLMRK